MTRLSNWREESALFEVVTGKMTDEKALKKVSEKNVNNKVTINPKLAEAMDELGGEVLEVNEALAPSRQELQIMKKVNRLQLRLQKEKRRTTKEAEKAQKDNEDVKKFCEVNFNINFPLSASTEVKGDNAHEIFKWAESNHGKSAIPKWNFYKILINKHGKIEQTYSSITNPMSKKIIKKIENIL